MDPFRFAQFCLFAMPLMAMDAVRSGYEAFAGPPRPRVVYDPPDDYRDPDGRRGPDPIAKDIL